MKNVLFVFLLLASCRSLHDLSIENSTSSNIYYKALYTPKNEYNIDSLYKITEKSKYTVLRPEETHVMNPYLGRMQLNRVTDEVIICFVKDTVRNDKLLKHFDKVNVVDLRTLKKKDVVVTY